MVMLVRATRAAERPRGATAWGWATRPVKVALPVSWAEKDAIVDRFVGEWRDG